MQDCKGQESDPVYCEAYVESWGLDVPCLSADNVCEARCRLADGLEQAKEASPEYADLIDAAGVDYVYDRFCSSTDCASDTDTDTDSCDDNTPYWRMDCRDESGTGCSIQFNVSVDVCQLNAEFSIVDVYSALKVPFVYVVDEEFNYLDKICGESDLSITAYKVDYKTDFAQVWGQRDVTTDGDCEDLTAVCGDNLDEKSFGVFASISFYCGDCDDLIDLYSQLTAMSARREFTPMYSDRCLDESVSVDSICLDGFGSIEVTDYSMEMKDENGEEILVVQMGGNGAGKSSLMVVATLLTVMLSL